MEVVSFTLMQPYVSGNSSRYPLDIRVDFKAGLGVVAKKKSYPYRE
jgi:hypothetical protein